MQPQDHRPQDAEVVRRDRQAARTVAEREQEILAAAGSGLLAAAGAEAVW